MISAERPIFHIHVPKTAGLTLRMIFAELLGPDKVFKLGVYAPGKAHTLEDFLMQKWPRGDVAVPAVYLGHFPFGAQKQLSARPFVTSCVRNPVDRVLSRYEYVLRSQATTMPVEEYIAADAESNNGMVRRLCGFHMVNDTYMDVVTGTPVGRDEMDIRPEDLSRALQNIADEIDFVMVQERMTESLVALRRALGCQPMFSLHNQSRNSRDKLTKAENYPDGLCAEILQRNQLDQALYDAVTEDFEVMIASAGFDPLEVTAMDDICSALMIPGQQDLPAQVVDQRLSEAINVVLASNDLLRAEMMTRLLSARLPHSAQIASLHATMVQRCKAAGQTISNT